MGDEQQRKAQLRAEIDDECKVVMNATEVEERIKIWSNELHECCVKFLTPFIKQLLEQVENKPKRKSVIANCCDRGIDCKCC